MQIHFFSSFPEINCQSGPFAADRFGPPVSKISRLAPFGEGDWRAHPPVRPDDRAFFPAQYGCGKVAQTDPEPILGWHTLL